MTPDAGVLVAFLSRTKHHQVNPATGTRPRFALTLWLDRRPETVAVVKAGRSRAPS